MATEGVTDTIFHKTMRKEIPTTFIYEDDKCIAIKDIATVAPIHYLIIPRKTIPRLSKVEEEGERLLGHLLNVAKKIARDEKLDNGFRIAISDSHHACQTVFQLHLHLIGGRQLSASMG
ncbi:Histidine triad nucleotide-binding protein 2, mitochondrial, partial [Fragariocoptes setiger]